MKDENCNNLKEEETAKYRISRVFNHSHYLNNQ